MKIIGTLLLVGILVVIVSFGIQYFRESQEVQAQRVAEEIVDRSLNLIDDAIEGLIDFMDW